MTYVTVGRFRLERGLLVMLVLFVVSLPFVTPRVAASDEIEYFSYLPSLVFDGDLNFLNQYQYFCDRDPVCVSPTFRQTFIDLKTPTGLQINFGPIGTALLWLPFYLVGHFVALVLGSFNPAFRADGVSPPYIYAVSYASALYGWAGIYLSYRLARHYFPEWAALGAALVILFATNAVYYMYVAPAFSHAASLFASALFVYVWWRTRAARAQASWRAWAALGASGGLVTMVREQEAVFFILVVVEGAILGYRARRGRAVGDLWRWLAGAAGMVVAAVIVFLPQFVVYRILNGNFLPARNVTDKFTWDGAHMGDVLFSNFHGLITWTPVVLVAVIGLVFLWRKDKVMTVAFVAALAAETYLLGSFSTWFGGASFGMRRFINATVIFVVGLAAFADMVTARVPRLALVGAGALLVLWNLFFIIQFATGMIPRQEPVDMFVMARNQFFAVPPRLFEIAARFVTNRSSFYRP